MVIKVIYDLIIEQGNVTYLTDLTHMTFKTFELLNLSSPMSLFEQQSNEFIPRHIGPGKADTKAMLKTIGVSSLEELIEKTVPPAIRMKESLNIPAAMSENEYLTHIKEVSHK